MTETVRNVTIIDEAMTRWDRRRTDVVRDAYKRIIELEETETGKQLEPKDHVKWLDGISRGTGVRVMHKKDSLQTVLEEMQHSGRYDDTFGDRGSVATFDPSEHFVIITEPSIVSYLAEPLAARIDIFGKNAMAVSPMFKCSVLWWNV